MADYFTVTNSFIGVLGRDEEVTYHAGEVVAASDPALKKWPEHFAPLVVRGVEQATAAPGEKRAVRRVVRKAKAPPAPKPVPKPEPVGAPLTSASFRPRPRDA
jgi:hypothetical protein